MFSLRTEFRIRVTGKGLASWPIFNHRLTQIHISTLTSVRMDKNTQKLAAISLVPPNTNEQCHVVRNSGNFDKVLASCNCFCIKVPVKISCSSMLTFLKFEYQTVVNIILICFLAS